MKPVKAGSPPRSNLFRQNSRIGQAQKDAFHALKKGERNTDAVNRLHRALFNIQKHSNLLTPDLLPTLKGTEGGWNVFFFGKEEHESARFGSTTEFSVQKFQSQLGGVTIDGKAGIETLPSLDKIAAFLEAQLGAELEDPTAADFEVSD